MAETCTTYMENCASLNTGIGTRPDSDNILELDAIILDSCNLHFGAAEATTEIQNPTAFARYTIEETDYLFKGVQVTPNHKESGA